MSDDTKTVAVPDEVYEKDPILGQQVREHDFTQKDLESIAAYKEAGLPGIAAVDDVKMATLIDLYLSGRTYHQMSTITRIKKDTIMYLSMRFDWFAMRREYIEDLEKTMRSRVYEAKIINQDFLLQLQAMWQKKIGAKITRYLMTGDESVTSSIDLKEIDKYLKTIEMIHKLNGDNAGSLENRPIVGLNAGDGVTIVKKGNNEIEITPKKKAIGEMLKSLADAKRKEEI